MMVQVEALRSRARSVARGVAREADARAARARGVPVPVVRRMDFPFGQALPRWWFGGNPVVTHLANGLNLVFPEGERFFVRSVRHYLEQLEDPTLRARAQAFFGQEVQHGREHGRAFEQLEAQGYDIRRFLDMYERWLPRLEQRFPPAMRLAVTVALEHLTATLGEEALSDDFLDQAHPVMRDLLRWHAAEEIEHKSVAFDVFEAVDGRYAVRATGMVLAFAGLMTFWSIATRSLLAQEEGLSKAEIRRLRRAVRRERGGRTDALLRRAFIEYLAPSFHPDQRDNRHLAMSYLERVGRLAG